MFFKGKGYFMNIYLDKKQINDINEFKELIECKENVKIKNYGKNNKFDFTPIDSIGSPATNKEARPAIVFEIDNDNRIFILRWLYLKYPQKGTGTLIFSWIKQYCEKYKFKSFEVKSVENDKIVMSKLCRIMGMKVYGKSYDEEGNEYYNYKYEFDFNNK